MSKLIAVLVLLLLVVVIGAVVLLSSRDISPPSAKVEQVVPDARFAR